MESQHYYSLRRFLMSQIKIEQVDGQILVNEISLDQLRIHSEILVDRFIGEYTRNVVAYHKKQLAIKQEYGQIRYKLARAFNNTFQVNFDDPNRELNYEVFAVEENVNQEAFKEAINAKWNTYHFALEFLDEKIKNIVPFKENKPSFTKRAKANPAKFRFHLDDNQFVMIYDAMQNMGYKQKILTGLFSDLNRPSDSRYFDYFSKNFPETANFIRLVKQIDLNVEKIGFDYYKNLIYELQREESRFVIERIVAEFINRYEGEFISTIHDSVVVKCDMLEPTKQLMLECFEMEGVDPKLEITVYSKNK